MDKDIEHNDLLAACVNLSASIWSKFNVFYEIHKIYQPHKGKCYMIKYAIKKHRHQSRLWYRDLEEIKMELQGYLESLRSTDEHERNETDD